jgi:hypothetical protein
VAVEGRHDSIAHELGLPYDLPAKKATATDHEKIHAATLLAHIDNEIHTRYLLQKGGAVPGRVTTGRRVWP